MSNRALTIIGLIASFLGIGVSVVAAFTEHNRISVISLFIVEALIVLIWVYYARQKNRVLFPFEFESKFRLLRYIFEDANTMSCEVVEVLKITHPFVSRKQIKLFWSGRGTLDLETPMLRQKLAPMMDGLTGEIRFDYPLLPAARFGDVVTVYYRMNLQDKTTENKPELYAQVRIPSDLLVMEVILKYKDASEPAWFGSRLAEGDPSAFLPYQHISDLPFDTKLKSYRSVIPKPILHHKYQIKWEK